MKRGLIVTVIILIASTIPACNMKSKTDITSNPQAMREEPAQTVTMLMPQGYYKDAYKKFQDKLKAEENIMLDIRVVANNLQYLLETIETKGNGITPIYMSNNGRHGSSYLPGWTEIPEFKTILRLYLDLYHKGYVNQNHAAATYEDAEEGHWLPEKRRWFLTVNGQWAT